MFAWKVHPVDGRAAIVIDDKFLAKWPDEPQEGYDETPRQYLINKYLTDEERYCLVNSLTDDWTAQETM